MENVPNYILDKAEELYPASLYKDSINVQKMYIHGRMDQKDQEDNILKTALWKIANPIAHLQQEAEKEGGKLDGAGAIYLSNNANWLQEIARKALQELNQAIWR